MDIFAGLIAIALILLVGYYLGVYKGAPFLPTDKETVERMIRLAEIKPGEKLADLGSGDGRVVIAAARAGAEAHGYEINPLLVAIAKWTIKKAGLSGRAFIHWQNFWRTDFSNYQVITIFSITHIMDGLEKKLQKGLPIGARIICNTFPFHHWIGTKEKNTYRYERT